MQLFRYAVVGSLTNITGYLVYLLLTTVGMTPKSSMTALYAIGAVIGFIGNRRFTFSDSGAVLGSGVRYAISHLIGYLLNFVLLLLFVDGFGYPHQFVQGIAILVVAGFLFLAFKFFVFTDVGATKSIEIGSSIHRARD